jgi:hypothetical protein
MRGQGSWESEQGRMHKRNGKYRQKRRGKKGESEKKRAWWKMERYEMAM